MNSSHSAQKFLFIQIILGFIVIVVAQSDQNNNNPRRQRRNQQQLNQYKHDITYEENSKQIDDKFLFNVMDGYGAEADEQAELSQSQSQLQMHSEPAIEIDINGKCHEGCICQYAQFKDLPTFRWINYMQRSYKDKLTKTNNRDIFDALDDYTKSDDNINFIMNSHIIQATCILQGDTNINKLIDSLPHNVQALILLYTGIGRNISVNASVLKPLNQLTTLELRGSKQGYVHFILDIPLSFIQFANFEYISLMGSDAYKKPPNMIHPKNMFDYKPNIEFLKDVSDKMDNKMFIKDLRESLNQPFEYQDEQFQYYDEKLFRDLQNDQHLVELDIIPYEIYREEVKRARMPIFYGWQNLEILRIYSCGLDELSWEMFFDLPNLQHLSLECNGIKTIPPFALSGATQLKSLSLAHNTITDLHYRDLAGLFHLEQLDLRDNRLSKLTEFTFPPLPKLRWIDFRQNPIRHIFPATFWIMNHTQAMWFESKEVALELWSNAPFKTLHHLKLLYIGNVSITNLDSNIFKDLRGLQILELHGNIRTLEFDAFTDLQGLRKLDISQCNLKEISMDALMGCKQLRIINFSYNNLTFIPPGLFDDQWLLEEIYLNDNQLTTLARNCLPQRKLKLARLNNNPWKCNCDMMTWKPRITNQEHEIPTENCITDYLSDRNSSCWKSNEFKFNRKYTPRCNNFKGRSVYYVLRKQLSCGNQKIVHYTNNNNTPHWKKVEQYIQNFDSTSNRVQNQLSWPSRREKNFVIN